MDKFIELLLASIREHLKLFGIAQFSLFVPKKEIAQFSLFVPKKEKGKKISPPNIKTPLPRGVKPKINRHEQHK